MTGEKISELKDKSTEMIQSEGQRKEIEENRTAPWRPMGHTKHINICVMNPRRREKKGSEKYFKKQWQKNLKVDKNH